MRAAFTARLLAWFAAGLLGSSPAGYAQPVHQAILWPVLNLQVGGGKSALSGEFTPQGRLLRQRPPLQVLAGTAHLRCKLSGTRLLLAAGYAWAHRPEAGGLRLVQAYGYYSWEKSRWHPFVRVAYDYLWHPQGAERPASGLPYGRTRVLLGFAPPPGKKLRLLFTGEPFPYGQGAWLPENRVQAGFRRTISDKLSVDVLYFNRWRRPLTEAAAHHWEHAMQVALHYSAGFPIRQTHGGLFGDGH